MQHRGPRPDLDVFRPLFYLGKLPEAPKSPRPVTPLLLSNPAPNADGHKMFFELLTHCLRGWMRFVLGKLRFATAENEPAFPECQEDLGKRSVPVKAQQELTL